MSTNISKDDLQSTSNAAETHNQSANHTTNGTMNNVTTTHEQGTTASVDPNSTVDEFISQFRQAPADLVKSEKAKGLVDSSWDGYLKTLVNHIKPCPMCGSTFPPISGCGYCH